MKIIAFFLILVCSSGLLFSQTYPNYFDHYIDSPPSQFDALDTIPESAQRRGAYLHKGKVFDVKIKSFTNKDININGSDIKVRYYSASKIFKNVQVVCLYKNDGEGWKCFMGRFFTRHEESYGLGIEDSDKHVIGLIHPHLANLLVRTINFHPEGSQNHGEWQNSGGVQVTGRPKWVAAHMAHNKHVVISLLSDRNYSNPLQEIIEANSLLDQAESSESALNKPAETTKGGFAL